MSDFVWGYDDECANYGGVPLEYIQVGIIDVVHLQATLAHMDRVDMGHKEDEDRHS